ncbi:hypothetical protein E2C01_021799 [Portunus trituberculatus]|uniref:Uncharacterized protein n=1 Tax=Portunus trituberculatus TaxID=210409 RepID=A0A5B7E3P9_PORTR|nr:hypothetical protein [Portunus trituberculatus]
MNGVDSVKWAWYGSKETVTRETVAPSEEAQPTLIQWTGFEPVRLETPRTPKHAWFHCTTAALVSNA